MSVSGKWKKKSARVVKVRRADGTVKEYRYPAYKPRSKPAADTVDALIVSWQQSQAWAGLAPSSRHVYEIYVRTISTFFGPEVVGAINRRTLLEAQDNIARSRGPGAANMFIRTASSLFNWAVDRGWIDRSPAYRVPMRPGGSHPTWTREQVQTALAGLPEHLRRVVLLAAYTGQRRGDLCALTWAAYDGDTLRMTQHKTSTPMVIAVHSALKRELDVWKPAATTLTILANSQGRPWVPDVLTDSLKRAVARLGLPRLNVHGLRSMFASALASQGASVHMIQAGTGHRTLGMVAHYTRAADQQRLNQDAISLLPDLSLTKPYKNRKNADGV